MFKRILYLTLIIFNIYLPVYAMPVTDITAKSFVLIEAKTGKIIFERDAEKMMYPASTTKMMTLIVALENSKLDEIVTASTVASQTEGSTLWLAPGEQLSMRDMLYGIILVSGNDATVAVAEHIAGSVTDFAKLMNKKAKEISANNTHFVNSSGLPDPEHFSTAYDLAKIAAYGYKNPQFTEIVGTNHKIIPWAGKEFNRELFNENRILSLVDGGNGVKTGYTSLAGRCLVSGANRNGVQLIAVVLDSERMWDDSIKLLNSGFEKINTNKVFNKGEIVKNLKIKEGYADNVNVVANEDVLLPIINNEQEAYNIVVEVPPTVKAPIKKGEKVGSINVFYGDKSIEQIDLLANENVEKKSFILTIFNSLSFLFDNVRKAI